MGAKSIGGEKSCGVIFNEIYFYHNSINWKMVKGMIMVKTEEDWKYQLFYNCISFIEWIDGLLLKSHIECLLVILFYMFDPVLFISLRY